MKESKRGTFVFAAMLLVIFGVMLALNLATPRMMDDFDYSVSWATGQRVSGIADILASQAAHYRLWGGRSVVHTLAQFFLQGDGTFACFKWANSAVFCLLLLEMLALAGERERRGDWRVLAAAFAGCFFLLPFFGVVFLWLTGACNYLWGTALGLLPLLVFLRWEKSGRIFKKQTVHVLLLPVFFLAGWTNENTAAGVFALLGLTLLARAIAGRRFDPWQWAALAAQGLGTAVMLLAPGNFARAGTMEGGGLLAELLSRMVIVSYCMVRYCGIPLALAGLLFAVGKKRGICLRLPLCLWLVLGAVLTGYALVGSPSISDRSFTAPFALSMAAMLCLLSDWLASGAGKWSARPAAFAAAIGVLAVSGALAFSVCCDYKAAWNAQLSEIAGAAARGEESVRVPGMASRSRLTMEIALAPDAGTWPNSTLSKYYGIDVLGENVAEK